MINPNEEQPEITPQQREAWNNQVTAVNEAMKEYTKPFVTPISRVMADDEGEYGELHGTGNYFQLSGRKYLLTNEHVARAIQLNSLGHQFFNCAGVYRAKNPFLVFRHPVDVAVSVIDQVVWVYTPHNGAAIPEDKWALAHETVKGEILFFKGYAGAESRFLFNHLVSNATSYSMQEVPLPDNDEHTHSEERLEPKFHFAINYRPDRAIRIGENNPGLPNPRGFSGSLIWNTRFVEMASAGKEWSPHCAVVTGLVWAWPQSKHRCLIATRVEYVRSFLLRALQL